MFLLSAGGSYDANGSYGINLMMQIILIVLLVLMAPNVPTAPMVPKVVTSMMATMVVKVHLIDSRGSDDYYGASVANGFYGSTGSYGPNGVLCY